MAYSGSNIDFNSLSEGVNALQRNPALDNVRVAAGGVTVSTTALYSVVVPTGTAVVFDTAGVQYTVAAPGMTWPFGAPVAWSPKIGPVSISSAASFSVIYHL